MNFSSFFTPTPAHLPPKEIPSQTIPSIVTSEFSPDECLDNILKFDNIDHHPIYNSSDNETYISLKIKDSFSLIKDLKNSHNLDNTSQNNEIIEKQQHIDDADGIEECHIELDIEDNIEDESKIGVPSAAKSKIFLLKACFLHYCLEVIRLYNTVIRKGMSISLRDLQFLNEEQRIGNDLTSFMSRLNSEFERYSGVITEFRFALIIVKLFKRQLAVTYIFWVIYPCVSFCLALFIDNLLYAYEHDINGNEKYYWAMALSIGFFFQYISGSWGWYTLFEFNTKFRLLMINALYVKVMKLNNFSIQKANIGKIINIIANDMNTVEFKLLFLLFLFTTPITLIFSIFLLWKELGPISILAIPILSIIYIIQRTMSSKNVRNIKKKNIFSDQRLKLCNELIEGIRLLKIYAWEMTLKKFIDDLRFNEIQVLKKYSYFVYFDRSLSTNASYIVCLILFFVYNSIDNNNILTPSLVFSIFQLMEYIRTFQVSYVGVGISFFFEFKVVLRRIIDILTISEIKEITYDNSNDTKDDVTDRNKDILLNIDNFTAYWDPEPNINTKPVLRNISMKIEKGKLYGIIGKIASGKSSFFYSILKEIPRYTGFLKNNATSLAYVEQEPFIIHGTVRSNILFYKPFDEKLYRKILNVCCLEKDLKEFHNKDLTEIGERGINLSGGQKARISLARALYSQAELYILDDPLSALDAKVGRNIFKMAIKRFLKGKTVILATHQIQFMKDVDYIYLFDNGEIVKKGCFNDFKHDLMNYFPCNEQSKTELDIKMAEDSVVEKFDSEDNMDSLNRSVEGSSERIIKMRLSPTKINRNFKKSCSIKPEIKLKKLYENQEDSDAQVNLKTYLHFFKQAKSKTIILTCISLFLLFEGAKYCTSFLFSYFGRNSPNFTNQTIFIALFFIVISQSLICLCKYFCFVIIVLRSNLRIHEKMTQSIVRAPCLFFDTHQSGSILNRFSNDIGLMDSLLILTLIEFIDIFLSFSSGIIISGSINYWFFIPAFLSIVLLYSFFLIAKPVILGLKKLDLQYKSPIYSYFSSTITGLTTINVYNKNVQFLAEYSNLIENSARCNNNFWEISRGFGFVVENISKMLSTIGLFTTLYLSNQPTGIIGQQIIYLILISETLQWGLRQAINADSVMSSALRALRFSEITSEDEIYKPKDRELITQIQVFQSARGSEQEELHILNVLSHNPLNELKGQWPTQGHIIFNKVCMKYRNELDLILNELSFTVLPGEKIGVVGRTGAGKSSLIQALFRMVEYHKGSIEIDGINIKDIGLHTLRGNISIIPQNPYVFSGSIKRNLDPMGLSNEEDIWRVLTDVELKDHVMGLEGGINADMSYAKGVFSVGQKQLLCLARAILKKNKILVLDEATANVDLNTDILIQRKIKELFKMCSIITVAHRLLSIADYDKVLVMEKGRIVEFDEPFLLLSSEEEEEEGKISKNGYFADMVRAMGEETAGVVLEITRKCYYERRRNLMGYVEEER